MKKFLEISHNDSYTTIKNIVNNFTDVITIGWNNLNVPKLDAINFKLNRAIESQADTVKYHEMRLMEEKNKLNSLKSIKQNLKEENVKLRKAKGIEIMLKSGEITMVDSEVLEMLDPEDYKLLSIGEFKTSIKVEEIY
jgi:pyoverdine/dityrosine biosynthesis protein Dit1